MPVAIAMMEPMSLRFAGTTGMSELCPELGALVDDLGVDLGIALIRHISCDLGRAVSYPGRSANQEH
jgi:hypothetical protein